MIVTQWMSPDSRLSLANARPRIIEVSVSVISVCVCVCARARRCSSYLPNFPGLPPCEVKKMRETFLNMTWGTFSHPADESGVEAPLRIQPLDGWSRRHPRRLPAAVVRWLGWLGCFLVGWLVGLVPGGPEARRVCYHKICI